MRKTGAMFILWLACLLAATSAAVCQVPQSNAGNSSAWPEAIEDNSFLVEEAYNQEPGVVQWIFGGLYTPANRMWAFSFTNEWPAPMETHQLSYTVPWLDANSGGSSGIGDILLNYRYQLCLESEKGVTIAPRVSVILPTGDWRKGLGAGVIGWQINLPVSKRIGPNWAVHLNGGATLLPSAKSLDASGLSYRHDLWGVNEGASLIWLATPRFNLMLEAVAFQQNQFSDDGGKERIHQALLSPGFRYAFNLPKGQLVLGGALPIGITSDTPNHAVFLYLSWEAPVWKPKAR